ncbi:MAG: tannase/feruloyl esterase family alpha/beta hydrolase [Gemmatimonadaceae bacterium]
MGRRRRAQRAGSDRERILQPGGAMRVCLQAMTISFTLSAINLSAQQLPHLTAASNACANLRSVTLDEVRLTEVVDVRDSVGDSYKVRAPHCRVSGVIGKSIGFTAILPNDWNQRLLMGGNGGFAGSINEEMLASAKSGYLTISTNTGHQASGATARWALNELERQRDYGYLGVHRTAVVGKALAKAFYGSEARYSYFEGCSNGGRQGLMEAQRYPEDFDGIISGAPAAHWTRIVASFLKNTQAAFPDPSYFQHPIVTKENLALVGAKVLEKCDRLDGIADGIIDDPRDCHFDLGSVKACPQDHLAPDCLTRAQRRVIARIYTPVTDRGGKIIYAGQPIGGENDPEGWSSWITGPDAWAQENMHVPSVQAIFATEAGKYFIFNDSTWDYSRYRGSLMDDAKSWGEIVDADNPDLSRFAARNGRLILWHGWADPAVNPLATVDYYDKVRARDPKASAYVRLFMEPSVEHCSGGPSPSEVPWLDVITRWVENGVAPSQVTATKTDSTGKITISRPLCAYPGRAVYSGKGDTKDAANFVCRSRAGRS